MSGVPFNPMRKTPPPPPHTDTVGLTPTDYVLVSSADGHVFLAHRDCLCGSPLLRRTFAKRYNLVTDDVVVVFDDDARALHSSTSPWDQPTPEVKPRMSAFVVGTEQADGSEAAFSPSFPDPQEGDAEAGDGAPALRPIAVNESLQNDNTVIITFPQYTAGVVDLLIAYLYYKQRYDGVTNTQRPPFDIPKAHAIELMKLASALEC